MQEEQQFLGAFGKLRKVTISFVMFVRLSFRMEQLGYRWTDFHEIWYLSNFLKKIWRENSSLIKIWQEWQVLYMTINLHFWSYLAHFFLERDIFQTKFVDEIKIHFTSNNIFFENRAFYEIKWKNIVQPDRPQMTS